VHRAFSPCRTSEWQPLGPGPDLSGCFLRADEPAYRALINDACIYALPEEPQAIPYVRSH